MYRWWRSHEAMRNSLGRGMERERRKRALGIPLVRGWGDTERADSEAGREWVKQERGVLRAK